MWHQRCPRTPWPILEPSPHFAFRLRKLCREEAQKRLGEAWAVLGRFRDFRILVPFARIWRCRCDVCDVFPQLQRAPPTAPNVFPQLPKRPRNGPQNPVETKSSDASQELPGLSGELSRQQEVLEEASEPRGILRLFDLSLISLISLISLALLYIYIYICISGVALLAPFCSSMPVSDPVGRGLSDASVP